MDTSRSVVVRFFRNHRPGLRELAVFVAVLAIFFTSGACGLLYQVVWTRKLVLLFGTAAYAVSTVVDLLPGPGGRQPVGRASGGPEQEPAAAVWRV